MTQKTKICYPWHQDQYGNVYGPPSIPFEELGPNALRQPHIATFGKDATNQFRSILLAAPEMFETIKAVAEDPSEENLAKLKILAEQIERFYWPV